MRYSLDGKAWSAKVPTAARVGTHAVRYRVAATDAVHADSAVGTVKATIAKAKNTVNAKGKTVDAFPR